MAKFSQKMGGKEVGSASVYAKPHRNPETSGRPVPAGEKLVATRVNGPQPSTVAVDSQNNGSFRPDPNTMAANKSMPGGNIPTRRVSLGDITFEPKTTGVKMRGTGCATKGVMSRGPMA